MDSPFGKSSIFYTPVIVDNGVGNFETTGDIPLVTIGFTSLQGLNDFLLSEDISNLLKKNPLRIICVYLKNTSSVTAENLVFVVSGKISDYINSSNIDDYINQMLVILTKDKEFKFSTEQVKKAFEAGIPYNFKELTSKIKFSKEQQQLYKQNFDKLNAIVVNAGDPETQAAILLLCRTLVEINSDVLQSYNQLSDVRYDTSYPTRKLTASDILYMARRLKKLQGEITKFQNGDFKTADDVVSFVNLNIVDPSALGVGTKFIINYPFEKLSYQRRREMVLLFLDGKKELSFSGFWAGATWDTSRKVSAGDVVYNLLTTGSEADRIKLVQELEKETKIFDLLNQADDNGFLFNITAVIANESLKQSPLADNSSLKADLMKQGNFIYFDIALLKDQTENLKEKPKKIELVNNSVYNIAGEAADDFQKLIEDYKQKYSSPKTLFNPLELVVLFAEDDINAEVIKLKKGDSVILPACVVYLLFKEDTNRAVNFFVALTTTVIFLPFGVSGLIAAIRAANTLGIIVTATDIAVDAAYLTYSTPNVQNSDLREDLEWINAVAAIYGLARLSYALKDVKGVQLLKDIKAAISSLIKEGKLLLGSGGSLKYLKVLSRNMIKQEERMSCGVACIRQIAKDAGIQLEESYIRELARTSDLGTTPQGMTDAMIKIFGKEKLEIAMKYQDGISDARMAIDISKDGPWIAWTKNEVTDKIAHCIIVDKIVDSKVYIRDPWPLEDFEKGLSGVEATMDIKDFSSAWAKGYNFMYKLKK